MKPEGYLEEGLDDAAGRGADECIVVTRCVKLPLTGALRCSPPEGLLTPFFFLQGRQPLWGDGIILRDSVD